MKWSGILTRWVSAYQPRKVLVLEFFSRLKLMHSRGSMPCISKINFKLKAFIVKKKVVRLKPD